MKENNLISGKGFRSLFNEIKECKSSKQCSPLKVRCYYFEPNPDTVTVVRGDGQFIGRLDRRVMFVCESPGGSAEQCGATLTRIGWSATTATGVGIHKMSMLHEVRSRYGLNNCYITNAIKCGVRSGKKHSDDEIDTCKRFLVKEIELIQPSFLVAFGNMTAHILRTKIAPLLNNSAEIHKVTHYSARYNPWRDWDKQFPELIDLLEELNR